MESPSEADAVTKSPVHESVQGTGQLTFSTMRLHISAGRVAIILAMRCRGIKRPQYHVKRCWLLTHVQNRLGPGDHVASSNDDAREPRPDGDTDRDSHSVCQILPSPERGYVRGDRCKVSIPDRRPIPAVESSRKRRLRPSLDRILLLHCDSQDCDHDCGEAESGGKGAAAATARDD
jgi:hypothetical protein